MDIMNILIVGAGRAGTSFAAALGAQHRVTLVHHDELPADVDADLVLLTVRDDAIESTAARLVVSAHTVVAHVSGSRGLDVLGSHSRVGSLHPLAALPNAQVGARRLHGGSFAIEGDELISHVVRSLSGRVITVAEDRRTLYHATAVSAANHLVALMGHVEVLAVAAGLELRDFLALAQQALDDVGALGPARALTGPASRGDLATLDARVAALPGAERATYVALADRALRLAEANSTVPWNA
jgi:predicted short-subunit dehydrogenase-like oxidoreductase (DUF2520 family)